MERPHDALANLLERRAFDCRLTPDRALRTLEEAEAFLAERGMLTLTPDCALPSLFGACHEESYQPGGHGFASWPKTKWSWGFALAGRPGVIALKLHRGKTLFLSARLVPAVDSLCRTELFRASEGAYGPSAGELVSFLTAAGPTLLDDIKRELGIEAAALRATRQRLERVGAVVSRSMVVPAQHGGERETTELACWDQRFLRAPDEPAGTLAELVVAGVRAAVVAQTGEVGSWFSWPLPRDLLTDLIEQGHLLEPQLGWVAAHGH